MPPLTKSEIQELFDAILASCTLQDLTLLSRLELNEPLERIVITNRPLPSIVLDLIEWADKRGRTDELARALRKAQPENQVVQDVTARILGISVVAAANANTLEKTASDSRNNLTVSEGAIREQLRNELLHLFPARAELEMLLDDALSTNLADIAADTLPLPKVVFELIKWAWVDLQFRMRLLIEQAIELRPGSEELKTVNQLLIRQKLIR